MHEAQALKHDEGCVLTSKEHCKGLKNPVELGWELTRAEKRILTRMLPRCRPCLYMQDFTHAGAKM